MRYALRGSRRRKWKSVDGKVVVPVVRPLRGNRLAWALLIASALSLLCLAKILWAVWSGWWWHNMNSRVVDGMFSLAGFTHEDVKAVRHRLRHGGWVPFATAVSEEEVEDALGEPDATATATFAPGSVPRDVLVLRPVTDRVLVYEDHSAAAYVWVDAMGNVEAVYIGHK